MKVTPSQQQKPTPNKFSKKRSNKEPPSSKRPLISWFRLHNSVMSPEFLLNSLFHSVPVKGDYKLSKKNEILVDLFLSTLFHAVPPRSPLPPFQPFLPTKFASSFLFLKFCLFLFFFTSASLPTGSPRVEVRSEATWLVHIAEREQPGNKGAHCWGSVARCQTFTFTPHL